MQRHEHGLLSVCCRIKHLIVEWHYIYDERAQVRINSCYLSNLKHRTFIERSGVGSMCPKPPLISLHVSSLTAYYSSFSVKGQSNLSNQHNQGTLWDYQDFSTETISTSITNYKGKIYFFSNVLCCFFTSGYHTSYFNLRNLFDTVWYSS